MSSKDRILSGINYILSNAASLNGHTCLPLEEIVCSAREILEIDEKSIRSAVDALLDRF